MHMNRCFYFLLLIISSYSVLGSTASFSFQEEPIRAEIIYNRLDRFLEDTSLLGASNFKNYLKNLEVESAPNNIRLAKVISLSNLGFFNSKSGQLYEAIDSYKQAWELYKKYSLEGYDIINMCAIPLGNLYIQTNAYKEAERIIEFYILLAEQKGDARTIVSGIINLSALYQSQGSPKRSVVLLEKALVKTPDEASLHMNLASAYYALGNSEKALLEAEKAYRLAPEMPNVLKLKASIYKDQKEFQKAVIALKSALVLFDQNQESRVREYAKTYLAMAEIQLADFLLNSKNEEEFLSSIHSVYSLLIPLHGPTEEFPEENLLYGENTLVDALEVHARYYEHKGEYEKALKLLESSFVVVDMLNHKALLQESRLVQQSREKQRCERYLYMTQELLKTSPDQNLILKALIAVDRVKSKIATDNFLKSQHIIEKADPKLLQRIKYLEKQEASFSNEIFYARRSSSISDKDYLKLLKASEENRNLLQLEYNKIDQDPTQNELSVMVLKEKFQNQTETYINYFIGSLYTYQFSIQDGTYSLNRLTKTKTEQDTLIATCKRFNSFFNHSAVILNDPEQYAHVAYNLFRLLKIPNDDALVISPDGILSFIPFDALFTEEREFTSFQDNPYLIKKSEISYSTSSKVYVSAYRELPESPSILGLFPVFDSSDRMLRYSLEEADAIEAQFKMKKLFKNDATKAHFFSESGSYDILHLSTHASSGSFLAPASLSFIDQDIAVEQLYGERWSPALVVLSACETGVGKIIKGEGAQSLARGFYYAGAKNILFSQWKVNDRATAILMGSYYKNLRASKSRNNSLHRAKLEYLKSSDIKDLEKSPYYWSSFAYYGAIDIPKVHNLNYWLWVLSFVVELIVVIVLFKFYAKNRKTS